MPVRSQSHGDRCGNLSDQNNSGHQSLYYVERSLKGGVKIESMKQNYNSSINDGCVI